MQSLSFLREKQTEARLPEGKEVGRQRPRGARGPQTTERLQPRAARGKMQPPPPSILTALLAPWSGPRDTDSWLLTSRTGREYLTDVLSYYAGGHLVPESQETYMKMIKNNWHQWQIHSVLDTIWSTLYVLQILKHHICVCVYISLSLQSTYVIDCLLSPFYRWGHGVQELYKKLIKFPQLLRNRQGDKPRHPISWAHALKCYLLINSFASVSLMSYFTMSVKYVTTWESIQQLKSLFFKFLLIWIDLVHRLNSQKLFSTKCNLKSQFLKMPSRVLCVFLCLSGSKDIIRTFTHFSFISWG